MSAIPIPEPIALPADQRRFLGLVFDHFSRTGDWPGVPSLQRELARKGERFDLDPVARRVPKELGFFNFNDRTFNLSVQGVITMASRSQEVADFETVMQLCCRLYLNEDRPRLTSTMLHDGEGFNELRLKKLHALLPTAALLTAGGSTSADGAWEFTVAGECHHLLDTKTAQEYVTKVAKIRSEVVAGPAVPIVGRGTNQLRRISQAADAATPQGAGPHEQLLAVVDRLHPRIRDACRRLVADDHLSLAVHKASIALKDLLKERSGLSFDGDDLANQTLSPKAPRIVVADLATETGRNVQRGVHALAQGVFAAMRNPVAHNDLEFDPDEVLEMLATISYVARKVSAKRAAPSSIDTPGRGDEWTSLEHRLRSAPQLLALLDRLRQQIRTEIDTRRLGWTLYVNINQQYFSFQRDRERRHDDVIGAEYWTRQPCVMLTLLRATSRRIRDVADKQFPGHDVEWCARGYMRVHVRTIEEIPKLVSRAIDLVLPDL